MTNSQITVRNAKIEDLAYLKAFFIKAYGLQTIFQDETFLMHFFSEFDNENEIFNNCIIAINSNNEIISHYGGIKYNVLISNVSYPMVWGVNAYTLPEWRGQGVNSKIVKFINNNYTINGVIGFTRKTAIFYEKNNYNVFKQNRFDRYIYILDLKKTIDVVRSINQDTKRFFEISKVKRHNVDNHDFENVMELTLNNINNFAINLNQEFHNITTTYRTKRFLLWRFLLNPYINYKVYSFIKDKDLIAYVALREEILNPIDKKVLRIIDLFGNKDAVEVLLNKVIQLSNKGKYIYVDFSMFGFVYEKVLNSTSFVKLENEDCCLIPQVTSPVENRPNMEFIGLKSDKFGKEIKKLAKETVYFTRVDSDRDRLAKITQIKK